MRQFELECRPFYVAGFNAHDLVPKALANPAEHKTESMPCPRPCMPSVAWYATVEAIVALGQQGSGQPSRSRTLCQAVQSSAGIVRRWCLGGQATRWGSTWCVTCLPTQPSGSSTQCACMRTPLTPTTPSWCADFHPLLSALSPASDNHYCVM